MKRILSLALFAVISAAPCLSAQTIPAGIKGDIEKRARAKWADNREMQVHTIQEETQAYRELRRMKLPDRVPADVFTRIKQRAQGKWSTNYGMQLHTVNQQIDAYRK